MSNLTDRQIKALTMVTDGSLANLARTTDGYMLVPSSRLDGSFYKTSSTSCTCPDATYRVTYCKHMISIQLLKTLSVSALEQPEDDAYVAPNGTTIPAGMRAQRED